MASLAALATAVQVVQTVSALEAQAVAWYLPLAQLLQTVHVSAVPTVVPPSALSSPCVRKYPVVHALPKTSQSFSRRTQQVRRSETHETRLVSASAQVYVASVAALVTVGQVVQVSAAPARPSVR